MTALRAALVAAVGEEHVSTQAGEQDGLRVTPGSAAEVAEVIRRAGAAGAAIHPVGAREFIPSTTIKTSFYRS